MLAFQKLNNPPWKQCTQIPSLWGTEKFEEEPLPNSPLNHLDSDIKDLIFAFPAIICGGIQVNDIGIIP